MTEISRLKSTSVSILVVLGLFYFGVLGYLTAVFVGLALKGQPTLFLVMALLACAYSARMAWSWIGLIASAAALNFRGLIVTGERLALVAPAVRSLPVSQIKSVRAGEVKLGPWAHRFLEFDVAGGGKWRIPGFLLEKPTAEAAERARATLSLS